MAKKNEKTETEASHSHSGYDSKDEFLAPPVPNPNTRPDIKLENDDSQDALYPPPLLPSPDPDPVRELRISTENSPRPDPVRELHVVGENVRELRAATENVETEYKNHRRFIMKPHQDKLILFGLLKKTAKDLESPEAEDETKSLSDDTSLQKTLLRNFVMQAKNVGYLKPLTTLFERRTPGPSLGEKLMRKIFDPELIQEQLDREKVYEQVRRRKSASSPE